MGHRIKIIPGTWIQLIKQVYQAEIELLPHRRYPMAKMKQDIGTQDLLFETAFNYTHFYLLKNLKKLPEFELLDIRANSETEFVLRAEFSRHFFTDNICLSLHYHKNVFTNEQIDKIGKYYINILTSMTSNPESEHQLCLLLDKDDPIGKLKVTPLSRPVS